MRPARSAFWLLSLAMGTSTVGRSMLGTAVPMFAVALGLAPVWVGVLVALPNALPVVRAMPAGRWVDRRGAGRWLAVGTAGMASAPLLLVLAPAAASLALAQLLLGVFQLFAALASQSIVVGLANGRSLECNDASYATLRSAGRLVGPLLAGVAIDARGFPAAFAIAAAVSLFTFAPAWGIAGPWAGRPAGCPARPGRRRRRPPSVLAPRSGTWACSWRSSRRSSSGPSCPTCRGRSGDPRAP